MPMKRGFRRRDDALAARLLTFRPLKLASFRGSNPQDAVLGVITFDKRRFL
jgi:hypothetical protein